MLEALIEAEPGLPELYANLGAALIRQGESRRALEVLAAAIERFPTYPPLYSNAVGAARAAGDAVRADAFHEKAKHLAEVDPVLLFGQGLEAYQRADYPGAAALFDRAARAQPDSAEIHAWRARARERLTE